MKKKRHFAIILLGFVIICSAFVFYNSKAKTLSNGIEVKDYKSFYNTVKEAMLHYNSTLTIYVASYDKSIYNPDVVKKVLMDNPELKGNFSKYDLKVAKTLFSARLIFNFKYYESKAVIEGREKAVQDKVKEIVGKIIKKDMKDYEKEAALHDYIVNNTKYDVRFDKGNMPKESYTAYGVLIKGEGVCQGYAQAMDRLLNACGIENMMVTGEADNGKGWIGHAWNIVKIGGQYYHLDTTWDDPVTENGADKLRYSYFNVTDKQIAQNHKWNRSDYPVCDSDDYSFNKLNLTEKDSNGNIIIAVKNYKAFYEEIKKALAAGRTAVTYRIIEYDDHPNNIKYWIESAYKDLNKSGKYSVYYYKDDMLGCAYVTVNFVHY